MRRSRSFRTRGLLAIGLLAGLATGCRQDMHDQPKLKPLREEASFADRRSARPLVAGTVARGELHEDPLFETGKTDQGFVAEPPLEVNEALLLRGRERFEIFCSPCHGRTGRGDGMIVQRGFKRPASFHVDRLRAMPVGYFYDVMTRGFGAMPRYAEQVSPADRWAIAAYLRVLQYSQYAPAADVPAGAKGELDKSDAAPTPPSEERHR